ncbi:MAG: 50S ribosomal protein L6 [Myxococcales bacterium]|nr:50S ribosomal protein L6 [Myxococcales bacterium]
MSRVAKKPINLPTGVKIDVSGQAVNIKGPKGSLDHLLHSDVGLALEGDVLNVVPRSEAPGARAQAGTARAILFNMVEGVAKGFEQKLEIVGVGYRAQAKGNVLSLTLGFSHPVDFPVPDGITIETPSQTEIVVKGVDKQKVGQVAANIRAYRRPEPYKGKGVKYAGEKILRKEAKKT